ncbi:MAG TPA: RDD family protein [Bryobacteraceae bacterium]|nr:RDD family protein [Bryobacteraceae bacterium]
MTTCHYCRTQNEADDHRCQRCGRRLIEQARPRAEAFPVSTSALAPDLRYEAPATAAAAPAFGPQIVPPPVPRPSDAPADPAYQASLFGLHEVPRTAVPAPARKPAPPPAPRVRRDRTAQQSLDFTANAATTRTLKTSVDAAIYCNARVAITAHRVMAAAIDTSIGILALGAFLLTLHLSGQHLEFGRQATPLYLGVAVVILLFYKALFCIAGSDTPGLHWTGLRLLNFDGHLPTRRQRFNRLIGGCVSLIASGLGLLWALCDEERLTWHDHMSKTFPTSY